MFGATIVHGGADERGKQMVTYETRSIVTTKLSADEIFKIGGKTITTLFRDIDCATQEDDSRALSLIAEIRVNEISPTTKSSSLRLTNMFLSLGTLPDKNIEELNKENFEKFLATVKTEEPKKKRESTYQKISIRSTARPVYTGEKGRIITIIDEVCKEMNFNYPALIKAIVHCESGFNQYAVSSCGAKGLMQIMPKYFGKLMDEYGVVDLCSDEIGNLKIGIHWIEYLLTKYEGDINKALVAYNGGESVVDRQGKTHNSYSEKVLNMVGDYM